MRRASIQINELITMIIIVLHFLVTAESPSALDLDIQSSREVLQKSTSAVSSLSTTFTTFELSTTSKFNLQLHAL